MLGFKLQGNQMVDQAVDKTNLYLLEAIVERKWQILRLNINQVEMKWYSHSILIQIQ